MSLIIETLDGQIYDLEAIGVKVSSLVIDSLSPRIESETMDGRDGFIDTGITFEGRSLRASFYLSETNRQRFVENRNRIFSLFRSKQYFYLIEKHLPDRRWKVRTNASFQMNKISFYMGTFNVEFIAPLPYAESRGTTLCPTYTEGYFQVSTSEPVQYIFNQNKFSVWNEGDIAVDPCVHPLSITFNGASNQLAIKNLTNGTEWSFKDSSLESDSIILEGIRSYKNSKDYSIFGQTNRKLISLEQGWNEFEISGSTSPFEVSFDFRFYYI
ncbi:phage tail family protein [Bacillus infantis]|uniref:phage tail family protein n=1 Tax=Bacillus infantis TaxID=324767 RepID=UPI003CE9A00C